MSSFSNFNKRVAKLVAFAWINGSFMKNSDCVGTVVVWLKAVLVGVGAVE